MSVEIAKLSELIEKEVVLHVTKEDDPTSMDEVTGTIKAASEAGVAFKEKSKPGIDLIMPSRIEEVALAPEKLATVSKKKLKPIVPGKMRQHLADRHGIELAWCRNATEEDAVKFHEGLDHTKLGHDHTGTDKPAEGEAAAEGAETPTEDEDAA